MKSDKIWISIGTSRKETQWKNKEISWDALLEKLRSTTRTAETIEKYMSMKPENQDTIKDVGGFVGGIIEGGRRKAGSVSRRQLITLDIDTGPSDYADNFLNDLSLIYDCAACVYSTHKHTPEKPRLRLLIPLNREVMADEYEAIGRKIAENIGIDQFDPTTFQPSRLMYWPSTSKNGQYFYQTQDGQWLDADAVLHEYSNWRDVSQWAYHSKVNQKIKRGIQKQGDPLQKPGIIGIFNNTYDIHEAIEKFLSNVYEKTDKHDRYTYSEGSTSAGVVVYDDVFAYSHHATDPAGDKLCNAFDLVRIHLFGEYDGNKPDDGVPVNKLPSYKAMMEFCSSDAETKKNIIKKQIKSTQDDFNDSETDSSDSAGTDDSDSDGGDNTSTDSDDNSSDSSGSRLDKRSGKKVIKKKPEEDDSEWLKKLDVDRKGNCHPTIANCVLILQNDRRLKGVFSFNEFDKRIVLLRSLPWRKVTKKNNIPTDADDAAIRNYFEKVYKINNRLKIEDALSIVAHKNGFHPVKEYLKALTWDGTERVEKVLVDYYGAEDNVYVREVTKKTFVAAVARVFEPGCKFDNVLSLVGEEGLGKSELPARIGMEWFSDTFGSLQNKDAMEQIQGVWIMEVGEMAQLKKAETEMVKLFISKREDRFRVAYGKRVETYPRECIFIATTNEEMFLKDSNGNRRFWPVKVGERQSEKNIFELEKSEVGQLWAEACVMYANGEELHLSREVEALAREEQMRHFETDDRAGMVRDYLEMLVPDNWYDMDIYQRRAFIAGDEISGKGVFKRTKISIPEIWCELMNGHIKDMSFYNVKYIRNIMQHFKDWKPQIIKTHAYGTQRGYRHNASKMRAKY